MSVLDVAHLSHSYGGRDIFDDVSFRLEKGAARGPGGGQRGRKIHLYVHQSPANSESG